MFIKIDINVCRICLKTEKGLLLSKNTQLAEKFQYVTKIKLIKNDGLPDILCNKCISRLKISNDFLQQSIASDQHLRQFITKVNTEFNQVTTSKAIAPTTNNLFGSSNKLKDEEPEEEFNLLMEVGYETQSNSNENVAAAGTDIVILNDNLKTLASTSTIYNITNDDDEINKNIKIDGRTTDDDEQEVQLVKNLNNEEYEQNNNQNIGESNEDIFYEEYQHEDIFKSEDDNGNDDDYNNNDVENESDCDNIEYIEDSLIEEDVNNANVENNSTSNIQIEIINNTNNSDADVDEEENENENKQLIYTEQVYIIETKEDENNSEKLSTTKVLRQIKKESSDSTIHYCTKCSKDFSTKTNLMRHMQTHDGRKPYQCVICGKSFTQNGSLKQHMRIHTGERPFQCKECNRGFTQGKSLKFHMRRHTGEKPFTCSKCGLTFRQRDGLKRHDVVKHSDTKILTYPCTFCSKVLHSKYSIKLHLKKHERANNGEFKCNLCEKVFSSRVSLYNHNRQHTGEKPYKCETCGKEFSQKSSMISHVKQHLAVKPFTCLICNKGFTEKFQITAHLEKHNAKPMKRYRCDKCPKSFAIKRNLLNHLKNHANEMITIYNCADCAIGFNTQRGLKLHRNNQHKDFIGDLNDCELCSISFVSAADLNEHNSSVHDVVAVKCKICTQQFCSKKTFDDHMVDHEIDQITT